MPDSASAHLVTRALSLSDISKMFRQEGKEYLLEILRGVEKVQLKTQERGVKNFHINNSYLELDARRLRTAAATPINPDDNKTRVVGSGTDKKV
jgi:hypothetical protein